MTTDVHELLYEYALGALADEERHEVKQTLKDDDQLTAELWAIEEDLAMLAGDIEVLPPPPSLRQRLLDAVRHFGRLEGFAERMAEMIDDTIGRARYLLRLVDDDSAWLPLFPGCDLMHIRPGPKVAHLDVGLMRIDAGGGFPHHKHLGTETVLLLQGRVRDSEGSEHGPGDKVEKYAGTEHGFIVLGDERLIFLVVTGPVHIEGLSIPEPPDEFLH